MIENEKILITGASGEVAKPFIKYLSANNEVWGAARFSDTAAKDRVAALGAKPIAIDVAEGGLTALPADFTYVLHLAYYRGGTADFDGAVRVNGEGTGRILQHCHRAKAALVMSSSAIYAPIEDPWHFPKEDAALGGANVPWSPTSGSGKIAQEAVARFCAQAFDQPVTITRLNAIYGNAPRFLPVMHMDAIMAGREIVARSEPLPYHPIHEDDMCAQLEAMLNAASTKANIVNWGGDEVITLQDWCKMIGEFSGIEVKLRTQPVPNTTKTGGTDQGKRLGITGPSKIKFADGLRRIYDARYGTTSSASSV